MKLSKEEKKLLKFGKQLGIGDYIEEYITEGSHNIILADFLKDLAEKKNDQRYLEILDQIKQLPCNKSKIFEEPKKD